MITAKTSEDIIRTDRKAACVVDLREDAACSLGLEEVVVRCSGAYINPEFVFIDRSKDYLSVGHPNKVVQ